MLLVRQISGAEKGDAWALFKSSQTGYTSVMMVHSDVR